MDGIQPDQLEGSHGVVSFVFGYIPRLFLRENPMDDEGEGVMVILPERIFKNGRKP